MRALVRPRHRVGFLGHQLAEYTVGAALVAVGLHFGGAVELVLVAVGGVLLALNLCSRGRLGVWRVVSRRAHHVADLALVGVLVASPLTALQQLHVTGVVLAELLAAFLLWVERATRYAPGPLPATGAAAPADAPATGGAPVAGGAPAPVGAPAGGARTASAGSAERVGRAAGRAGAAGRNGAEVIGALGPPAAALAGKAARTSARRLGVAVGRTKRALRDAKRPEGGAGAAGATGEAGAAALPATGEATGEAAGGAAGAARGASWPAREGGR